MITRKRSYTFALTLLFFAVCAAQHASAQNQPLRLPRPSQKASVMQTIGVTDVTIIYSRPGVKNRVIWGEKRAQAQAEAQPGSAGNPLVPYGAVWRTGANEATQFIVTDDVLINGQPLPTGTYSLHTIPRRDEWTVIFNKDAGQQGGFTYDEKKDALRIKVKPQAVAESQEWMMFSFDPVTPNSAQVSMRWEKVRVPFTVEVKDVNSLTIEKARAAVAAAKPEDWQTRLQAANFAFSNNIFTEEAGQWLDQSIKIKETFGNLSTKARVLASQGKTQEAIATGEKALQTGKAAKANQQAIADLEKRVAEWKAKKM